MKNFTYKLGFSIINWLEATANLLTLGFYCPSWTYNYAKWSIEKEMKNKIREKYLMRQ